MRLLIKPFDFYINSSIHVGIAVFCLVQITILSDHLIGLNNYSTCVFFGTVIGYNFLKYYEVHKKWNYYLRNHLGTLIMSVLAFLGFLISFLKMEHTIQKSILYAGLFVLFYPFIRKYGWLKIFWVSLVVTFITTYIPFQTEKLSQNKFGINLVQRLLIIVSLLIPFEILDSTTDDTSMNTLPQRFGIKKAKLFGIILVIPFIILEFFKVNSSFIILPISLLTVGFIVFSSQERNKYYTSFWVESIPIIWWLLILIFG